jgi:hypothetical protein
VGVGAHVPHCRVAMAMGEMARALVDMQRVARLSTCPSRSVAGLAKGRRRPPRAKSRYGPRDTRACALCWLCPHRALLFCFGSGVQKLCSPTPLRQGWTRVCSAMDYNQAKQAKGTAALRLNAMPEILKATVAHHPLPWWHGMVMWISNKSCAKPTSMPRCTPTPRRSRPGGQPTATSSSTCPKTLCPGHGTVLDDYRGPCGRRRPCGRRPCGRRRLGAWAGTSWCRAVLTFVCLSINTVTLISLFECLN